MTLQQQIQSLAEQLEQLAKQVAEPMEQQDTEIEKLLIQAANYPFQYHLVAEQDDYIKGLYIQMLLSIVHQSEAAKIQRYSIIARMYYNLALPDSFENYITKSQMLTIENISHFYHLLKENNLIEVFLIDALMILGVQQEQRIGDYVTELVSNLDVSQEKFSRACYIVRAILKVDHVSLYNLFEKNRTFQYAAGHYLTAISSKFAPIIKIVGDENTVVDLNDYYAQELILEKVRIKNTSKSPITAMEKVILKGCKLLDGDVALKFEAIEELVIENLQFPVSKQAVVTGAVLPVNSIAINHVKNLQIKNLHVQNIKVREGYLFEIQDVNKLTVSENIFEKMSMQLKDNSSSKFYISSSSTIEAIICVQNIGTSSVMSNRLSNCINFNGYERNEISQIIYSK